MDLSTWTGERAYPVYMGAPPDYSRGDESRDINNDWQKPLEDPEEIGCPGSWVRSPFVISVLRYYRRRDENGGRVPNPKLDHCDDPLVHEAITALEYHDESGLRDHRDKLYEIRKRGSDGG